MKLLARTRFILYVPFYSLCTILFFMYFHCPESKQFISHTDKIFPLCVPKGFIPSPPHPGSLFLLRKTSFSYFIFGCFPAGSVYGKEGRMTSSAGSSSSSVPRQKQRRSGRRCGHSPGRDSPAASALGDFQTLPLEIFQMVLNYLSGEEPITNREI